MLLFKNEKDFDVLAQGEQEKFQTVILTEAVYGLRVFNIVVF